MIESKVEYIRLHNRLLRYQIQLTAVFISHFL